MFTPAEGMQGVHEKMPTTPGHLVKEGLSARLNVIFDVDHTLIYAFERGLSNIMPGCSRDTHLLKLNDARGTEMTLVVREGI